MNLVMLQILPLSPKLHQKFKNSGPIFDAIYISLNADMSGNQERCQKNDQLHYFHFFLLFYIKIRNFSFNSFPPKIILDPPPRSPSLRGDPQISVAFIKCVGSN